MLDYLQARPGAEASEVIAPLMGESAMDEIRATAHLARLIKYGLVCIEDTRSIA